MTRAKHNIKLAMDVRGVTGLELADEANIHPVRLSRIANGQLEAAAHERAKLAELLHADEGWLFSAFVTIPQPKASTGSESALVEAAAR